MGCGASSQPVTEKPSDYTPPPATAEEKLEKPAPEVVEEVVNFKPIHSAIRWNKPIAEIEVLLTSRAAVNSVDPNNGNCPIHIAAQNGHSEIIQLLIDKKADLDAKNGKGNTGIHMAVGYDYFETAQILIAAGADDKLPNDLGFPANLGLEGDKSMGIAALVCAQTASEVDDAFQRCQDNMSTLNKVNFVSAGLKAKKNLGGAWTTVHQEIFKSITSRLSQQSG